MNAPEYVSDDHASFEMWKEACASSQQWAAEARLQARKRKRKTNALGVAMATSLVALTTLFVLFMMDKIHP